MVGIGAASPVLCAAQGNNTGAVFIMTNDAKKNQVIAYERAANGTLSEPVYYDTNGRGSGGTTDPLESQGSADHGAGPDISFCRRGDRWESAGIEWNAAL